ncbi:hypothetical protein AAG747_02920 [Rapidithrix thailandica]|uniref:Uncharacterized protein n=1 Tax=Rapidithrix thailandica TaxID=413964 RepID=A0AAW9S536_9BACT
MENTIGSNRKVKGEKARPFNNDRVYFTYADDKEVSLKYRLLGLQT